MHYILKHKNYEEEVYDILISSTLERNYIFISNITYSYTIQDIIFLIDPNGHKTYVLNNKLYAQSGLVDLSILI